MFKDTKSVIRNHQKGHLYIMAKMKREKVTNNCFRNYHTENERQTDYPTSHQTPLLLPHTPQSHQGLQQ